MFDEKDQNGREPEEQKDDTAENRTDSQENTETEERTGGAQSGQPENRRDSYQYENYGGERYQSEPQNGSEWQRNAANRYRSGFEGQGEAGNGTNASFGNGTNASSGKKRMSSGAKIGIAAALLIVFCGICTALSFAAVSTVRQSAVTAEEETIPAEEAAVPEEDAAETEGTNNEIAKQGEIKQSETQTVTAVVTDVTEVVEEVMPAAVSITNEMITVANFWGQDVEQEQQASGSGIIIGENDSELLIVTNYHVVEDATRLYVQFIDNESAEAVVKGSSPSMDLAVIAINKEEMKESTKESICIARMGDSDALKIGEPAIAIGNALGYGQSVTTGVISALNRTLEVSETGTSNALIQTDAAINPGNSGGALLNITGEVIGINTNKIGGSVIEGMGYAIPISTAKPIIEELMLKETKQKVTDEERGYLGISCINVTQEVSAAYNMPVGIFVAQVYPGTGAEAAGLQKGDIITKFDGNTVTNQQDLTSCMQYYKVGETVTLTIMRGTPSGYAETQIDMELCSQEQLNQEEQ